MEIMIPEKIQYSTSEFEMIKNMHECYQFKDLNIYEHGISVSHEYLRLISNLDKNIVYDFLPPDILDIYHKNKHKLLLLSKMTFYQIMHDLGKPLCLSFDDEGRKHFYNHAEHSYQQFKLVYPNLIDEAFMIFHDMDFHTKKTDELVDLANSKYCFSLYLTAISEVIANSKMFGGVESDSFKIKVKKLKKHLKLFK